MAGFLYFVPNCQCPGRPVEALKSAGLGYVVEDGDSWEARPVQNGPAGNTPGVVIGRSPDKVGYYPDQQSWRAIPKTEAMLGWQTNALPTPEELARPTLLIGQDIKLGDGRHWRAPIVFEAPQIGENDKFRLMLPRRLDLNADGEYVRTGVAAGREAAYAAAEWWLNDVMLRERAAGELPLFDVGEALAAAETLLATNYRIGRVEIVTLGLLDEEYMQRVLEVAIDSAAFWTYLRKKSESAGSSTNAGPADSTPDTAQRSQT